MRISTKLFVLPAAAPLLMFGSAPASAAGPPTRIELAALGLAVGTENSHNYLYATGPAAIVSALCVDGIDDGVVCAFTGRNETGTGAIIVIGNGFRPRTDCADIPLAKVRSVNNVTTLTVPLYDGSCARRGALDVRVPDNEPEDVPAADVMM